VLPPRVESLGLEAADFVASCGLVLDEWQRLVLEDALGIDNRGKWAAFEVGLVVPRQNGKGSVLEARELAGLFLLGEKLILHSAHEFKTSQEAFRRVLSLVDNTDHLRKRVKRIRTSHGEEGIELLDGARLRFVARSTGSGRGFTGDCVILDEAYNLGPAAMAALLPTMSSVPNPQLWYTSSSGTVLSEQLRAVRERAVGDAPGRLCYLEWSAPAEARLSPQDPEWAWMSNPSMGIRIPEEFVDAERNALSSAMDDFCRERLGLFDQVAGVDGVPLQRWAECGDSQSVLTGKMAFAVDMPWNRRSATVVAAGLNAAGLPHVEIVALRDGTSWVVPFLADLCARNNPVAVTLDPSGPAGSLLADLTQAGVPVTGTAGRAYGQACGAFLDAVLEGRIRHRNERALDDAVSGAIKRFTSDQFIWDRKSGMDISPLVAATLARWAFTASPTETAPGFVDLSEFMDDDDW
jgi:hypothetical protein